MEVTEVKLLPCCCFLGLLVCFQKETTYLTTKHPKKSKPKKPPNYHFFPAIQICMKRICICLHYDCVMQHRWLKTFRVWTCLRWSLVDVFYEFVKISFFFFPKVTPMLIDREVLSFDTGLTLTSSVKLLSPYCGASCFFRVLVPKFKIDIHSKYQLPLFAFRVVNYIYSPYLSITTISLCFFFSLPVIPSFPLSLMSL